MDRTTVYEIISQERDYQEQQNSQNGYQENGKPFSVAEEITLLQHYVSLAVKQWATNAGDTAALHEIRKIAAIAVRCMETHGAPKRNYLGAFPPGPK